MKKFLTLCLTLVMAMSVLFCMPACSNAKVVEDGGKIIVGVTDYPPMDYLDDNGKWIGFDAELATTVFTNLGYTVEFKEIDWDTKIVTLNAGTIDCIWNGMTVTDELLDNLVLSNVYLKNQQVLVAKTENLSSYTTTADLAGKKVAVESGSAAQKLVDALATAGEVQKLSNQNAAVLGVFAGTADVAVVDVALATTLCALGSDYFGKLAFKDVGFAPEEFAIAFRKSDSSLCWNVNKELRSLEEDGTILALAVKYKVTNLLPIFAD